MNEERIDWFDVSKNENCGFKEFSGVYNHKERFRINWIDTKKKNGEKFELLIVGLTNYNGIYFETLRAAKNRAESIIKSKLLKEESENGCD